MQGSEWLLSLGRESKETSSKISSRDGGSKGSKVPNILQAQNVLYVYSSWSYVKILLHQL